MPFSETCPNSERAQFQLCQTRICAGQCVFVLFVYFYMCLYIQDSNCWSFYDWHVQKYVKGKGEDQRKENVAPDKLDSVQILFPFAFTLVPGACAGGLQECLSDKTQCC